MNAILNDLHRVLIPIVRNEQALEGPGEGPAEGKLWEFQCRPASVEELEKAPVIEQRDLIPAIDSLRTVRRYSSGRKAYHAIKRLIARGGETSPQPAQVREREGRTPTNLDNLRLSSSDGGAWVDWVTGDSTDLGLALNLLMSFARSPSRCVAATGELGDVDDDARNARDVVIRPVGGMAVKLRTILEKRRNRALPDDFRLVITPEQHILWTGDPPAPVLGPVVDLPEVAQLRGEGIEVVPVATLSEAAKALGIDLAAVPGDARRRWLKGMALVAGFAALALAAVVADWWREPLVLRFESAADRGVAAPYLICRDPQGMFSGVEPLPTSNGVPVMPVDRELGWTARLDGQEAAIWGFRLARGTFDYQGAHLAAVLIGRTTGLTADSIQLPNRRNSSNAIRLLPDEAWRHQWKIDEHSEPTLLVLLARRFQPFQTRELKALLEASGAARPDRVDFDGVLETLKREADAVLQFRFEARGDHHACNYPQDR